MDVCVCVGCRNKCLLVDDLLRWGDKVLVGEGDLEGDQHVEAHACWQIFFSMWSNSWSPLFQVSWLRDVLREYDFLTLDRKCTQSFLSTGMRVSVMLLRK